jgi:superfamily II DNA or RNA helicase
VTASSSTATRTDSTFSSSPPCLPCVRLFADSVVITSASFLSWDVDEAVAPLIELHFDYGGTRVRAGDDGRHVFSTPAGGIEPLRRDAVAEAGARRLLERLGAVELACVDAIAPPDGCEAEYIVRADGDRHTFCAFTARALAEWRALGWKIEVDAAYPFRVVETEPAWYARIEACDERPDWFGLELGVEIEGVRVDLLAVILDLVDRLDGDLDSLESSCRSTWAIRVSDTHHVNVPIERLRALVRAVSELYQGGHRAERSFPEIRATALAELDATFRRGGVHLAWSDTSGVAERAVSYAAPLEPAPAPRGLRATLRPYQAEGVCFLQRLRKDGKGGVLADDMGLGKTLQTIAHICIEREEGRLDAPALVVGPTSLVGNWSREIAKFAPHLRVVVIHGPDRRSRWPEAARADIVITTYPVLVRDEARFAELRFHVAILDEAQAIKNAHSQARRALERVTAGHRVCLTGTPIENHLGELWSLFDWLAPGLLGDELSFRRFWRQPIEKDRDEERLAALRALIKPYVLRRFKRDVARELPPKTELSTPVELGGKQRELYEAIRVAAHADVRRAIRSKGIAAATIAILDALTKLRQVCCDPRLVAMDAARPVLESAKLDALIALLGQELACGHRILVFSQFTSMLALIGESLHGHAIPHLVLTGETRHRQRVVDAFEEGRADVFLISLKAGGTGLNLTSADTVVHYDPWWNPAAQSQATDRAYRIGQRRPVFVHNLYAAGSVEERVMALQQRKRSLSTALLGGDAQSRPMGDSDIEALFAPLEG